MGWPWVAAVKDYRLFLAGMFAAPQMGQRSNNLGRLQPRGVIGIEVGKHDKAGAIEDVGGGYRQHPTFRPGLRRIGVAQRQVSGPELLWDGEGDAIARRDFASRILQYRKRRFAVSAWEDDLSRACGERATSVAPRRSISGWGRRKRLQFENTKRAPVAPEKADDDGTAIKEIRQG